MALLAYQATPAYPRPQHEDWLCYQRLTGQVLNACGVPHTVVAAAQQQVWQAGPYMPYQAIFRRPRFQDSWQVTCTFP